MESLIDQRYRLLILEHQVEDVEQRLGGNKWIFRCPLCSPFARTESKKKEKKGALIWIHEKKCWVYRCHKCDISTNLFGFLKQINPPLARKYQKDRWHSGTTGKGRNCPNPKIA
jgi:hypothetical protein